MKCVAVLLFVASANHVFGASDDYHVEQVHSPYVSPMDQGTHMTNRNARSQGLQGNFGPYGSSSKHEVHEEQRYVNGQPVYEKRHERRFEDGRLVHEDGHEKGHPELASAHLLGSSSGYGIAGGGAGGGSGSNSYRSSSSRRYEASGSGYGSGSSLEAGGFEGTNVNVHSNIGTYGDSGTGYDGAGSSSSRSSSSSRTSLVSHTPEDFEDTFRTDVDRLRQRLHQGTAVIREPVTGTSLHEEKRQEARFVNGQQVYHKKEERRFEDGRLVHDVSDETGDQNAGAIPTVTVGEGINSASTLRRSGYESSVATGSQDASPTENNPPSNTAYRASYYRPGPQERRVSTTSQRRTSQVSAGYQPGDARVRPAAEVTPYQNAYRTSTNRIRTEVNKPTYRASYTPSHTVERVSQRVDSAAPAVASQVSSASSQSQYSSTSSGYQAVVPSTQRPSTSQSVSESSNYRRAYSNKHYAGVPEPSVATGPSYQPRPAAASPSYQPNPELGYTYQPSSQSTSESVASRREFSTAYGSGSYVRPTEASAAARTTSRITDTYSEPYSVRSSSYQPSRFANYSSWSHWKKESNQPTPLASGAATSQSQFSQSNNFRNSVDDRAADPSENTYSYPSAPQTSTSQRTTQQSQTVRAFSPGFLYDEDETDENEIGDEDDDVGYGSSRSQASQYEGFSSGSSYPASSSSRSSQSEYSSGTYTSNTPRTTDGSIGAGPGGQVALSITLNAGQGDTFRVGSARRSETEETDQDRYDISPLVDGGVDLSADNEVDTRYTGGRGSSSSASSGSHSSSFNSQYGGNVDFHSNAPSISGQAGYSSGRAYDSSSSRYNEELHPVSGSSYDRTTRITNRTTNTLTSQVQPLVSSYKMEIRSSKRYLNGKLVSETRYNRYYENGVMVHENQTERSRDEMLTDGVDVDALDLTTADLASYGLLEAGNQESMSHSQRFEMHQEKEFVDGNQVFEATHSKRYQDGELIQENRDEKDRDTLALLGRNSLHNTGTGSAISGQDLSGGSYSSNFIQNRNYGSSVDTGSYPGPPRGGARQITGTGETVTVSLSPRTRTRKTEVRQEQEYRDGEQVYDLRHERQFDDGQLVHEDLSEKGPDELGSPGHNDALQAILTGQTLGTASQSGYRPSPAAVAVQQRQESSYSVDGSLDTLNRGGDYEYTRSQNRAYDAGHEVDRTSSSSQGSSVQSLGSQSTQGQIGTKLLTSGCLTCVIGGGGIEQFDTLANAPSVSTGSSSSSSSSSNTETTKYGGGATRRGVSGGGYYSIVGGGSGGSGSGYGGATGGSGSGYGGASGGSGSGYGGASGGSGSGYGGATGGSGSGYGGASGGSGSGYGGASGGSGSGYGGATGGSGSGYGGASGGPGSGYGGVRTGSAHGAGAVSSTSGYSSESSSSRYGSGRSEFGSGGSDLSYGSAGAGVGGYQASTSFGAQGGGYGGGQAVTHRREMEMEERYENGQLVSGREEDKEWKNDNLIKHEHRKYGENDENRRYSASALTSPGLSSSSTYQSSGSSNQGVTNFGASATFGAHTHGYSGIVDSARHGSQGVGYQQGGAGYHGGSLGGSGGVLSHRREMEMEEHYENGQLVSGREEDKEWKNDELLRHDHRRYGEGGQSRPLPSPSIFSDSDSGRCSARPCLNGGSCIPSSTGYMCICTFGFKGLACEEAYCPARFCRHDGICQVTQDGGHNCSCPLQFTGPRCELRVRDRGSN